MAIVESESTCTHFGYSSLGTLVLAVTRLIFGCPLSFTLTVPVADPRVSVSGWTLTNSDTDIEQ